MRTFEDDDPLFAPMLNALFAAFRGTAVMSGCAPSATGADRVVTVAAGSVQIGGATVAVAGGTVTLDAGGEFDRYDLVTVDVTGSLVATKGTGVRKCPAQPADTCLIAIVLVPAEATVIATGDVYDARALMSNLTTLAATLAGNLTVAGGATFSGTLWAPQAQLIAPAAPDAGLLVHEDLTSSSRSPSGYVTVKSVTVPAWCVEAGGVYLDFNVGGLGYVQVIGGNETLTNPGVMTGLAAGDVIELQLQGNNDQLSTNTMFRVYAYEKPISAGRPWA